MYGVLLPKTSSALPTTKFANLVLVFLSHTLQVFDKCATSDGASTPNWIPSSNLPYPCKYLSGWCTYGDSY